MKLRHLENSGRCFRVVVFIVAMMATTESLYAHDDGQSWPRTSDNRVIIDVKGFRVVLPTQGPELEDITFTDEHSAPSNQRALRRIIDAPQAARKFFSEAKFVTINIFNFIDHAGLFMGRFDRSEYTSVRVGLSIGPSIADGCAALKRRRDNYMNFFKDSEKTADSVENYVNNDKPLKLLKTREVQDGWLEFSVRQASAYYLSVPKRPMAPSFLGLSCDASCAFQFCFAPDAEMTFRFSRAIFPVGEWRSIYARALDFAGNLTKLSDR